VLQGGDADCLFFEHYRVPIPITARWCRLLARPGSADRRSGGSASL